MKKFIAILVLGLLWNSTASSAVLKISKCFMSKSPFALKEEDRNKFVSRKDWVNKAFWLIDTEKGIATQVQERKDGKWDEEKKKMVLTGTTTEKWNYEVELVSEEMILLIRRVASEPTFIQYLKNRNDQHTLISRTQIDLKNEIIKTDMWPSRGIGLRDSWLKDGITKGRMADNSETKCEKWPSGLGGSGYLDYWWALILIIAVTFFIYTQSGNRLKKIRKNR